MLVAQVTECRSCMSFDNTPAAGQRRRITVCLCPESPMYNTIVSAIDSCSCHTDRPDPFEPQEIDEP